MEFITLPPGAEPIMLAVLRVVTGLLLVQHGTAKLFRLPPTTLFPKGTPLPPLERIAGVIDLTGGLLLLLGLWTAVVGLFLAGTMAMGYLMVHARKAFFPIQNDGGEAILYGVICLYLAFAGPGAFALGA